MRPNIMELVLTSDEAEWFFEIMITMKEWRIDEKNKINRETDIARFLELFLIELFKKNSVNPKFSHRCILSSRTISKILQGMNFSTCFGIILDWSDMCLPFGSKEGFLGWYTCDKVGIHVEVDISWIYWQVFLIENRHVYLFFRISKFPYIRS